MFNRPPVDQDWEEIHFRYSTVIDLHAHPSLNVSLFHRLLTSRVYPSNRAFDPFSVRTDFDKLDKGGVDVLLSVVYAPEKGIFDECRLLRLLRFFMPLAWKKIYGRPYIDVTLQMVDEIEREVEKASNQEGKRLIRFAHSVNELEQILAMGPGRPIAMVHCLEGGHSLSGDIRNVDALFQKGVAYMILAHFFENEIGYPVYPWPQSIQKFGCFRGERNVSLGLKPFGEQVVERMTELGMLVDVSHSTPLARACVYDIVGNRRPVIATHVGAYEINPDPYNLQDWEIRKIADSGGVIGVIFMNYWLMPHATLRGLNYIIRTIHHLVNVAGIDHVALGTDFDGFTDPPDDLKDASELPRLTQHLLAAGYNREEVSKILGGNALRVLREGWGRQV